VAAAAQERTGRRLLGRGSVYTLGTALQMLAAALALPAITRLLGASDYGIVSLALVVQALLSVVIGAGLPAAITREFFSAPRDGRSAEAARELVMSTLVIASLGTVLVAATVPLWGHALVGGSWEPLLLGVLIALPAAVAGSALGMLLVQERSTPYIAIALVSTAGAQALGLAALLLFGDDPFNYLLGYMAAVTAAAVAALGVTGSFRASPAQRPLLRRSLDLGLPTVPHSLAIFVLALGDRFVIQAIDGSSAVGRYQVAYALGALGIAMLSALQNAWVPITYGLPHDVRWESLSQTSVLVLRLAALGCGALALMAPLALPLLAPTSYQTDDLVPVAGLIALAGLPWAFYLPNTQILIWERKTRPLAWITPTAAIANLALVALLLPPFGLTGAAAATTTAIALQAALTHWAARREAAVPWQWERLGAAALIGIGLVAVGIALPTGAVYDAIRVGATVIIGAAALRTVARELLHPAAQAPSAGP
jgi:O-antigen/teichoic acid export membrane protein